MVRDYQNKMIALLLEDDKRMPPGLYDIFIIRCKMLFNKWNDFPADYIEEVGMFWIVLRSNEDLMLLDAPSAKTFYFVTPDDV